MTEFLTVFVAFGFGFAIGFIATSFLLESEESLLMKALMIFLFVLGFIFR